MENSAHLPPGLCVSHGVVANFGKARVGSVSLDSIYQIEATTDPDTTEDQERLMLQALLIERFKMIAHRETKGARPRLRPHGG